MVPTQLALALMLVLQLAVLGTVPARAETDRLGRAAVAVRDQLTAAHVPAAAYAVIDGADQSASGVGTGIGPDTPFLLGSLSKGFTALAVLQLVEAGDVDLDAPAARYVTELRASPSAQVTVRQLLSHTSGWPTGAGLDDVLHPERTLDERVAEAARIRPGATAFAYCNLNYAVLGALVERRSHLPYATYVQQRIFDPLGMTHSFTSVAAARRAGLPDGANVWFGANHREPPTAFDGALPDGYLISTVNDLARYLRFQLGSNADTDSDKVPVLSRAGVELLHTAVTATAADEVTTDTDYYALGWAAGTIDGHPVLAHPGDLLSFHADLALLPDQQRAIAVVTARNGLLTDPAAPFRAGLEALLDRPAANSGLSFIGTYVLLDLCCAVLVLGVGWQLRRLTDGRRRRPGPRHRRRAAVLASGALVAALVVAIAFLLGAGVPGVSLGTAVRLALASAGDLTMLIGLVVATLILAAVRGFRCARDLTPDQE